MSGTVRGLFLGGVIATLAWALGSEAEAQSLWRANRAPMGNMIADNVASARGDIVTIIIRERQQILDDESLETERKTKEDFNVSSFNIFPNAFDPLPNMQYDSNREFEGAAEFERNGLFETRLSAVVVDVQPNGNLVIEGKRIIKIGQETKTIRVSGLIRPLDLAGDNTVLSQNIANGEITYLSDGAMSAASEPGWFTKFLDIIWPF